MNKTAFIISIVLGLVCIGFAVYYVCVANYPFFAVFMLVGAGCAFNGIRSFVLYRRDKKRADEEDKNNEDNKDD